MYADMGGGARARQGHTAGGAGHGVHAAPRAAPAAAGRADGNVGNEMPLCQLDAN